MPAALAADAPAALLPAFFGPFPAALDGAESLPAALTALPADFAVFAIDALPAAVAVNAPFFGAAVPFATLGDVPGVGLREAPVL